MDGQLRQLGQRIQSLRKAKGWSQEKFADVCGVHRTYMGHLERGEKNLSFSTLVRLSDALEITVSELLSEERSSATKTIRQSRKNQPTDLPGIIRELNRQRNVLESTGSVLKQLAQGLRVHESKSRRKRM